MWDIACYASVKQANLIVSKKAECSYEEFIKKLTQLDIYHAQKLYYIQNASGERLLAILNSVPLFLVEYFDVDFWNRVKRISSWAIFFSDYKVFGAFLDIQ